MKRCSTCSEVKPLGEFWMDHSRPDGFCHHCKQCSLAKQRRYRKTQMGKRAISSGYKRYSATEHGKRAILKKTLRYRERKPHIVAAHQTVHHEVRMKRLLPLPCFICGSEKALAHHCSYSPDMRLAVTWLCHEHHQQVHMEAR